jgi:hypothetical protein
MTMRHLANIAAILVTAVAVVACTVFLEEQIVLQRSVIPAAGTLLPEWLDDFRWWSIAGIAVAAVAALIWYVLGAWVFLVNSPIDINRRPHWSLLLVLSVMPTMAAWWLTPSALVGTWMACGFWALNGAGTYYLATALFSPSGFAYTAPGSRHLRVW